MNDLLVVLSQIPQLHFCCLCKRGIEINSRWIYLSVEEGQALNKCGNISHSYCPICFQTTKKELEEYKKIKAKTIKELKG